MFDKRLFQLAPGLKKLIAGKVTLMWVGLFANIGFMLSLVMLLNSLLTAVAPPLLQCGGTSQGVACPVPLSDQHGADVLPMAGDVMIYVLLALVCIAVRYTATTHATRLGTEAAERVKLALRSKLYRKMVALGPSYKPASRPRMWCNPPAKVLNRFKASLNCSCRSSSMRFLRQSPCSWPLRRLTCPLLPSCWSARRSSSS